LYKDLDFSDVEKIEECGRVCYQSTKGNTRRFVENLLKNGHESVLEHVSATFFIICDRGVMAELTRHRLASFCVESTRYCDYSKKGLEFIRPFGLKDDNDWNVVWKSMVSAAESAYLKLRENGCPPEIARSVLPLALKCEMAVTANLREWRHILRLRTAPQAHPDMRLIASMVEAELRRVMPYVFGD
jgi:thymidylate synthase (FAD)